MVEKEMEALRRAIDAWCVSVVDASPAATTFATEAAKAFDALAKTLEDVPELDSEGQPSKGEIRRRLTQ